MLHTFENTYVNRIDLAKLAEHFVEELGEPVKLQHFNGLILKPKAGIIDEEIVLRAAVDGVVPIPIYQADKQDEQGRTMQAMYPTWTAHIHIETLKDFVIDALPLSEYVRGRRGYNSRLLSNEKIILNWLNEKK